MPNRILRDWTDSYSLETLSAEGERLFVRLIMKADDFGRYHADPRLVRAGCFPLLTRLRDAEIPHWIAECEKAGLIHVYQSGGRSYLSIVNFKQRGRTEESKFPAPDGKPKDWKPAGKMRLSGACPSDDGQMTAKTYSETETKTGAETALANANGYPLPEFAAIPKPLFAGTAAKLQKACDEQMEIIRAMSKSKRTPILGKTTEGTECRTGWRYPVEAELALKQWEKRKSEISKALAG